MPRVPVYHCYTALQLDLLPGGIRARALRPRIGPAATAVGARSLARQGSWWTTGDNRRLSSAAGCMCQTRPSLVGSAYSDSTQAEAPVTAACKFFAFASVALCLFSPTQVIGDCQRSWPKQRISRSAIITCRSCQRSGNALTQILRASSFERFERHHLPEDLAHHHPRPLTTQSAPCIDYPTLPHSTTPTVDTNHQQHVTLRSPIQGPSEQFWLALRLRRQTRVTLTVTTLTTSTPPSWRGFTLTGLATPALSSDQAGSFAEATSSSHLNWAG